MRPWLLLVLAVGATAAMAYPYVLLDPAASRIETTGPLHYTLLVVHVLTAAVALVLAPLQYIPRLRARRRVHRTIGHCYLLLGVVPSASAGIPLAMLSGRPLTQVGLTIPFLGWLVTGWLAYRAIRRRAIAAHREWMLRNVALTFLAITARVLVPIMVVVLSPFVGGAALTANVPSLISVGQVLGWVVNLTAVEAVIRRRRIGRTMPAGEMG